MAQTTVKKNAMKAKVGDSVELRIANDEENKAKIVQINQETGILYNIKTNKEVENILREFFV